jgi:hypothetical protein
MYSCFASICIYVYIGVFIWNTSCNSYYLHTCYTYNILIHSWFFKWKLWLWKQLEAFFPSFWFDSYWVFFENKKKHEICLVGWCLLQSHISSWCDEICPIWWSTQRNLLMYYIHEYPPRKKEGYYAYGLRVGGQLCSLIGVPSLALLRSRHLIRTPVSSQ